jgi:iron complex outermembrane receptor protein
VVSLRLGWRIRLKKGELEPCFGVNNLWNEHFYSNIRINAAGGRYYEPAAGRNWFVSLKGSF